MSCRLSGTCGSEVITSLMKEIESKLKKLEKQKQPTSWNDHTVAFLNQVQVGSKFEVKITASGMADIDVQWENGVSNNRSSLLPISPMSRLKWRLLKCISSISSLFKSRSMTRMIDRLGQCNA